MDCDRTAGSEREPAGFWAELTAQFDGGSLAVWKSAGPRPKFGHLKVTRWLWAELTAQSDGGSLAVQKPRYTPTEGRAVKGDAVALG